MNVIGLNETALRSLINSVSEGGFSTFPYSVTIHLYREASANDDITSLNLPLASDVVSGNFSKLSANCAGILFGTLAVTKSGGKIQLTVSPHATSNLFSISDEIFHKANPARSVFDVQANTSTGQTLGDCIIYKPNNMAAVTSTTTIAIPAVVDKATRLGSAGAVLIREAWTDKERFGTTDGYSLDIGRRHYSGLSYAGAAAVSFSEPVEADFMYMDLQYTGNTFFDRSLTLEVQNADNSFTSLGSFTGFITYAHRFNFSKRVIKGMRLLSPFASVASNTFTLYYLQAFTAGLKDYTGTALNNPVRAPITKAVISLNLNPTDRANAHRLPLMTVSVGDLNSSADFKMSSLTSSELTRTSFATQTLLELEA